MSKREETKRTRMRSEWPGLLELCAFMLIATSLAVGQANKDAPVAILTAETVKHAPKADQVNGWLRQAAQELQVSERALPHVIIMYVDGHTSAVEDLRNTIMMQVERSTTSKLPLYYIWLVDETGAEATIHGLIAVLDREFDRQLDQPTMLAIRDRICRRMRATVDVRELFRAK